MMLYLEHWLIISCYLISCYFYLHFLSLSSLFKIFLDKVSRNKDWINFHYNPFQDVYMNVNPKKPNYETIINQTDNGTSRCVKASYLRYPQCASRDNIRAKRPPFLIILSYVRWKKNAASLFNGSLNTRRHNNEQQKQWAILISIISVSRKR